MRVLVIGATGYVGSRLVPRLLAAGHSVRALVRDPAKAVAAGWPPAVAVVAGDVTDPAATRSAAAGTDAAVHLVHSLDAPGFADRDRRAARTLVAAAEAARLRRLVYLGGLQPAGPATSAHLASRREVGEVFLAGSVPAAVLQAGVVVGAGSAGFELIRRAVDAASAAWPLPAVLPLPDRAWNRVQPVGVDDLLHLLVAALDLPPDVHRTFDVGGPDVLTYREMATTYAQVAGLRRPVAVPLPVAAPRLTARLVGALTPFDRHLTGPLLASTAHDLVCREHDLADRAGPPPGGPTPYAEAVARALRGDGAAGPGPLDPPPAGPVLASTHVHDVDAPAAGLWAEIARLGGDTGWRTVPGVWRLRAALDGLLGGVGDRRGRPERLVPGAAVDWWRVEDVDPGRSVTLRAEMRLPGTARLELRAEPTGPATSRYVQRVTFAPRGLPGRAYWYAQLPAHELVFGVMARGVAAAAGAAAAGAAAQPGATS